MPPWKYLLPSFPCLLIIVFTAALVFTIPANEHFFKDPDIPQGEILSYRITNEDDPQRNRSLTIETTKQDEIYYIQLTTDYEENDQQTNNSIIKAEIYAPTMMPLYCEMMINNQIYYKAEYFLDRVRVFTDYRLVDEESSTPAVEGMVQLADIVLDRLLFFVQMRGLEFLSCDEVSVRFIVEGADYFSCNLNYLGIEKVQSIFTYKLEVDLVMPFGNILFWYETYPPHRLVKMEFDVLFAPEDGDVYRLGTP